MILVHQIIIETEKKKMKPELYVKYWHDKDLEDFNSVGIVFDSFSQTSSDKNRGFVQYVFNVLKKRESVYERKLYNIIVKKTLNFYLTVM